MTTKSRKRNKHLSLQEVEELKPGDRLRVVNIGNYPKRWIREGDIVEVVGTHYNFSTPSIEVFIPRLDFSANYYYWRFDLCHKDWFDIWVR